MTIKRPANVPEPVERVAGLMRAFQGSWFLIGGWAVDAWLGRQSREHADVDIGLFRDEEQALFEFLCGWHLVAHDTPDASHDDPWDGGQLRFPAHIHARHPDWPEIDFNFNERSGRRLSISRDPQISFDIDDAVRVSPWGLPTLVPEVIIWFKAKDVRPRDGLDTDALLPLLDGNQRDWLASTLARVTPDHPWLARLRGAPLSRPVGRCGRRAAR